MMWVENSRVSFFKKFTFGDDFSENVVEKKDVENEVDKEIARNIPAESLEELIYSQEHLNHAVAEAVALSNTKMIEDANKKEKEEIQYSLKKYVKKSAI
ncbi:hypothetical protein AA23498_2614 [Acetobacter nitrogenifigens DSM 23921 = NBRC 105050]|uniref:Uncharacterized protein n=1 Tax=Acetobacter nitrogenifigens DSM 23921 = NBRC 105050 TaxID=1120919 RepID=A0A511X5Z8_9PROT|nr:hypothetical protein [Acetobacter nitrogenifigens]GBQ96343.1 hypothetical protein AA23498_2614 [Acetobacter nitrogenifigens DSM 23921 = NBRC 105050]GEN58369.1 hypothetical protein ANI02nite_02530 [Acetobacter nitrogenifigens DSM 23921 = NBRC 105050]